MRSEALSLFIWIASGFVSLVLRFEYLPGFEILKKAIPMTIILWAFLKLVLATDVKLFGSHVPFSSDHAISIVRVSLVTSILATFPLLTFRDIGLPRSFALMNVSIASIIQILVGISQRELGRRKRSHKPTKSVIIFGSGSYSQSLIRLIQDQKNKEWRIIGLIDDDPTKHSRRFLGVKVIGDTQILEKAIQGYGVTDLIIAVANLETKRIIMLDDIARRNQVNVSIVPSLTALLAKNFNLSDLSYLDETELIGRKPLSPNLEELRKFFFEKRVIVTGAGGSIGSELCRQINSLGPSYLGLLDRDETGILNTQLTLDNQGLLTSTNLLLVDIRDRDRLEDIFKIHKPDIVFHAAALKHLPLLESNPIEAWKTNVLGTLNLLNVCKDHEVQKFVNVSTDKAASPISILGKSKLITEQMALYFADHSKSLDCISVRFGNVLGSRGSVIGTFNHQISQGGPVIVTDPEVSRYFMTIHEAVHLVLRSSILGKNGETLILDMGNPVKILDLAKKIISRSGKEIEIEFSGLRPGEKLHEVLFSDNELVEKSSDPLISKTFVRNLNSVDIDTLHEAFSSQQN